MTLYRETNMNAKQVVFMSGNETVVSDGVSEHSFLYDHSFWSTDKKQGSMLAFIFLLVEFFLYIFYFCHKKRSNHPNAC